MTVASLTRELLVTAIDLTRCCTEHEQYLTWLTLHSHGSAELAHYFSNAAIAFEEQAQPFLPSTFDPFVARENLSDLLITSPPLSHEGLRTAVSLAIQEAREDLQPFSHRCSHHQNGDTGHTCEVTR